MQNENARPLLQKVLRMSRQRQQSIKPSKEPCGTAQIAGSRSQASWCVLDTKQASFPGTAHLFPLSGSICWPLPTLLLAASRTTVLTIHSTQCGHLEGPQRGPQDITWWGGGRCTSAFFFFLINLFIYLFIFGCIGSSLRAQVFSSCGELGLLFVVVQRLLIVLASLVMEHRL